MSIKPESGPPPFEPCIVCMRGDTTTAFAIAGGPEWTVGGIRALLNMPMEAIAWEAIEELPDRARIRLCRSCAETHNLLVEEISAGVLPYHGKLDVIRAERAAMRWGTEYLAEVPAGVPSGRIIVHNHVRPVSPLGRNGFRAWLAAPGRPYVRCGCGWAPQLPEHYVVRRTA